MKGSFLLSWHKCNIICHEPISTKGYSLENLEEFKKKCYDVLDYELRKNFSPDWFYKITNFIYVFKEI